MTRITPRDLRLRKSSEKVAILTAYTAPHARIFDAHADALLVGDSLGMVLYGFESTLPVTLDMMIAHGAAVMRASQRACVVVDMPFASYQQSKEQAFASAARIIQETGCAAIKLEGGIEMAETIQFLTDRAIPVMAHIGLMPQHYSYGGFRVQGRTEQERKKILKDAEAIEQAGAFAVVLESMQEDVAAEVTKLLSIPTIGIGASPMCDGQVLVGEDMLGISGMQPKFVKQFAELEKQVSEAAAAYAREVKSGAFPGTEHVFSKKLNTPA